MNKTISIFVPVMCFLLSGCMKENMPEEVGPDKESPSFSLSGLPEIIVTASNVETATSQNMRNADDDPVVFTGRDILWFNETTKELRFHDNYAKKDVFTGFRFVNFYINYTFLFSSVINVNSTSSQVINSPVFYYNIMENKYYILDGYPAINEGNNWPDRNGTLSSGNEIIQQIRDENMQEIESEWNIFIALLKENGKLKN